MHPQPAALPWPLSYENNRSVALPSRFSEPLVLSPLDRRYVDEDILAAGIRLNETIPLRRIEPLYYSHRHAVPKIRQKERLARASDAGLILVIHPSPGSARPDTPKECLYRGGRVVVLRKAPA